MKKITHVFSTMLCLVLMSSVCVAQQANDNTPSIKPPTLQEKAGKSDAIIEGMVLEATCFKEKEHSRICTSAKVKVTKIFKGNITDTTIELVFVGGLLGDEFLVAKHGFSVDQGHDGIFFLNKNTSNILLGMESQSFIPSQGQYSYIQYHHDKANHPATCFGSYYSNLETDLFQKLEAATGVRRKVVAPNKFDTDFTAELKKKHLINAYRMRSGPCDPQSGDCSIVDFQFANAFYSGNNQFLEFDIVAKDELYGLIFSKGDLYIDYDAQTFGSNIYTNGNIVATKGSFIASPDYVMQLVDQSVNTLKVSVDHVLNPTTLNTLGLVDQQLVHMKLAVQSIGTTGFVSFNNSMMQGNVEYENSMGGSDQPYQVINVGQLLNATSATDINVQIANASYTSTPGFLTFDVQVQSGSGAFFHDASIDVGYNSSNFGTYVVSNSHLTCTSNFNTSEYTLSSPSDAGASSFGIVITGSFSEQGNHYDPNNPPSYSYPTINSYSTIATCALAIQNCNYSGSGDYVTVNSVSAHYTTFGYDDYGDPTDSLNNWTVTQNNGNPYGTGTLSGYDNGGQSICTFSPCTGTEITDLQPRTITAGTYSTLTITGCGFGATQGTGTVQFFNALQSSGYMTAGAMDIQSWSDTRIDVWVPSTETRFDGNCAGSGPVIVTPSGGSATYSPSGIEIYVPYANINFRDGTGSSGHPYAIAVNGLQSDGTLHFTPASNFSTLSTGGTTALTAATQAMNDWVCYTGANLIMDAPSASAANSGSDGLNSLLFAPLTSSPLSTTLGETEVFDQGRLMTCSYFPANLHYMAVLLDRDILFNQSQLSGSGSFDFSLGAAGVGHASFVQTARHEFGHGLALDHVSNVGANLDLMYWIQALGNGTVPPLSITSGAQNGGLYVLNTLVSNFGASNCVGNNIYLNQPITPTCTNGIADISSQFDLKAYPNPTEDKVILTGLIEKSQLIKVQIFNNLGQLLQNTDLGEINGKFEKTLNVADLSAGLYTIKITISGGSQSFKLSKL